MDTTTIQDRNESYATTKNRIQEQTEQLQIKNLAPERIAEKLHENDSQRTEQIASLIKDNFIGRSILKVD